MRRGTALLALGLFCALAAGTAQALSEFGIEGMGVVSTPASEPRASVSPDGRRIVWGSSERAGGADPHVAQCDGRTYADAAPLKLSFNRPAARTLGPVQSTPGQPGIIARRATTAPHPARNTSARHRRPRA